VPTRLVRRSFPNSAKVAEVHLELEGAQVLAISEDAATAIRGIVGASGVPEGAGLRITREMTTDDRGEPRTDLRLSVVAAPEEGDEVLEEERVFVDPDAAGLLKDKLLDADFVGDDVRFSLDLQAESR
jgi:iron-sulfur cluster assembly protein